MTGGKGDADISLRRLYNPLWTGQGFLGGTISFFRQHPALGRTGRYSRSMSASSACCSRARCI